MASDGRCGLFFLRRVLKIHVTEQDVRTNFLLWYTLLFILVLAIDCGSEASLLPVKKARQVRSSNILETDVADASWLWSLPFCPRVLPPRTNVHPDSGFT